MRRSSFTTRAYPMAQGVKNPPTMQERDGKIPWREVPDRLVYGVEKSRTGLSMPTSPYHE